MTDICKQCIIPDCEMRQDGLTDCVRFKPQDFKKIPNKTTQKEIKKEHKK